MASLRAGRPLLLLRNTATTSLRATSDITVPPSVPAESLKPGVQGSNHLLPFKGDPAEKRPVRVKMEAGRLYHWCACGRSRNQPWCDGSHKLAGGPSPGCKPVPYVPAKTKEVMLCLCKQTANRPFCDGAHRNLIPGPLNPRINDMDGYYIWEVDKKGSVAYKLGFRQEGGVVFHKHNRA